MAGLSVLAATRVGVADRHRTLLDEADAAITSCVALVRRGARVRLKGVTKPDTAPPPDQPRPVARPDSTQPSEADQVVALVYELLDAHDDTMQLASEMDFDQFWGAHLDYLRALQRKGREVLARTSAERPV
jgi:hypothetical protein